MRWLKSLHDLWQLLIQSLFNQRELLKEAEHHWDVNGNTIYQVENGIPVPSNPINPTTFVFGELYSIVYLIKMHQYRHDTNDEFISHWGLINVCI